MSDPNGTKIPGDDDFSIEVYPVPRRHSMPPKGASNHQFSSPEIVDELRAHVTPPAAAPASDRRSSVIAELFEIFPSLREAADRELDKARRTIADLSTTAQMRRDTLDVVFSRLGGSPTETVTHAVDRVLRERDQCRRERDIAHEVLHEVLAKVRAELKVPAGESIVEHARNVVKMSDDTAARTREYLEAMDRPHGAAEPLEYLRSLVLHKNQTRQIMQRLRELTECPSEESIVTHVRGVMQISNAIKDRFVALREVLEVPVDDDILPHVEKLVQDYQASALLVHEKQREIDRLTALDKRHDAIEAALKNDAIALSVKLDESLEAGYQLAKELSDIALELVGAMLEPVWINCRGCCRSSVGNVVHGCQCSGSDLWRDPRRAGDFLPSLWAERREATDQTKCPGCTEHCEDDSCTSEHPPCVDGGAQ